MLHLIWECAVGKQFLFALNRGRVLKDDPSFKEFVLFAALYMEAFRKNRNSIIHGGTLTIFEAIHRSLKRNSIIHGGTLRIFEAIHRSLKRNSIIHGGTMRMFEVIHRSLTSSFFYYREAIL
ncbi:hypothetical protein PanWU01x14_328000 [Parasponia andersonii]|uniref:Uncharacterized protein n=1 Tax=Parasponia andersonii TaxID=3476 RepID=A0A2P5AIZ9_PARAD|nr:hypothetical protein PanWU01x14_328000 [Parasponia andersonii]